MGFASAPKGAWVGAGMLLLSWDLVQDVYPFLPPPTTALCVVSLQHPAGSPAGPWAGCRRAPTPLPSQGAAAAWAASRGLPSAPPRAARATTQQRGTTATSAAESLVSRCPSPGHVPTLGADIPRSRRLSGLHLAMPWPSITFPCCFAGGRCCHSITAHSFPCAEPILQRE